MQEHAYNPPDNADDRPSAVELERLQTELDKWRERVPKLTAALRERTEQVKSLEQRMQVLEQSTADGPAGHPDAGIRARDELIEEIQVKNKELNANHQAVQGQLHSNELEINDLHAEVQLWKDKWQTLTQSLDEQSAVVAGKENELQEHFAELKTLGSQTAAQAEELSDKTHQLERLSDEAESLTARNEKLFETTELANRQIETLGESLDRLREELREKDRAADAVTAELDELKRGIETESQRSLGKDEDIDSLHGLVETKQGQIETLENKLVDHDAALAEQKRLQLATEQLQENLEQRLGDIESLTNTVRELQEYERTCAELQHDADSLRAELDGSSNSLGERDARVEALLAELREGAEEIERLTGRVTAAEADTTTHDQKWRDLSGQIEDADTQNQQLEARLGERSNLVVGLEKEKLELQGSVKDLDQEKEALADSLAKAERHAGEHAEHIGQLDDKLQRQQQLMLNLEEELAQAQQAMVTLEKDQVLALTEKDERIVVLEEELDVQGQSETLVDEQAEHLRELSDLKETQALALTESESVLAAEREEIENLQQCLAERDAELEKIRDSLNTVEEQHAAEVEGLKATLTSAEATQETSSADMDRFEKALGVALTVREEAEKDRDDFAARVDMLESELREEIKARESAEQALEAVEQTGAGNRSGDADPDVTDAQQLEVQKLEQMVRDRTEQLNKLQWREDMAKQAESSPMDNKMMMVLNQQLTDARASNERLVKRVQELESGQPQSGEASQDDLTRIRGIGLKLAEQLNELGIHRYDQIASLDKDDLEGEHHVLHPHKGRILRDGWIKQAVKLLK